MLGGTRPVRIKPKRISPQPAGSSPRRPRAVRLGHFSVTVSATLARDGSNLRSLAVEPSGGPFSLTAFRAGKRTKYAAGSPYSVDTRQNPHLSTPLAEIWARRVRFDGASARGVVGRSPGPRSRYARSASYGRNTLPAAASRSTPEKGKASRTLQTLPLRILRLGQCHLEVARHASATPAGIDIRGRTRAERAQHAA
jgi:hypothetical protein